MLAILIHSSKTMRPPNAKFTSYQTPALLEEAVELADYLTTLTPNELQTAMQLSPSMAIKTHELLRTWSMERSLQRPAIDAFLGDIYSGLQVQSFSDDDRQCANDHLFILSGLYGILRALDSIHPYRLEMGYKLPDGPYKNLYRFWNDRIAKHVPSGATIINLSAVEYTKAVLPYLRDTQVITPKFMTISPKTGEPTFVTVHAKIARGAFASWLIKNRIDDAADVTQFNDIGYKYDQALSTAESPVFVATEFKGIGLSVRLTK